MANDVKPGMSADDAAIEKIQFTPDWVGKISYWIFHYRKPLLILFILITILLGAMASQLRVQAAFTKMIPLKHPYMATFLEYQSDFGGANKVLVALQNKKGTIYDKQFMESLRKVTEEVFYIPGIERSSVASLFTSNVRFTEVVEDGFRGGNVVSADFAGTPEQMAKVQENLLKSDWVGRLVSNDQTAAMVVATLMENDPETGERLDLQAVAAQLEGIRAKYENENTGVHIIGFAKAVGDIAKGAAGVLVFFGIAFVITALLLYWYSGSLMITALALICAIVPVIWLLGLLPVFGSGARPDVDPGAVPDLLDRRLARGADDERLAARDPARRRRHHRLDAFVPEAVHPGRDGVARERARLHGHRVRRDRDRARAGLHGDDRRHGDDHHQQDAAADPALVLQVHARAGVETGRQGNGGRLALGTRRRARHQEGRVDPDRHRSRAAGLRPVAGAAPAHRRHRRGRARTAARLALQPGRRDDHQPLRDRRGPAAGHRRGEAGGRRRLALRRPRRHGQDRGLRIPDATGGGRGDRAQPGGLREVDDAVVRGDVREVAHAAREPCPDRAGRRLRHAPRQRVHELALHGHADQHLHLRPPGPDHRAHRAEGEGLQGGRRRHGARHLPAGERQRRRDGGHERGRRGGRQVGQPRAVRVGAWCCA